ncbi:hypothetical protein MMC09_003133 [Bachmanniomyces sp. S44760]|nr:hypothetical protein [Bachmanniomyces sp. S44760]
MPAEHGDPYSQVPVAPLDVADFADCSAGVSYLYDTEPSGVVTVPIYQNSTKCVPFVAPPFQVYDLDPAWKSCTVEFGGIYDPPYALQPAQAAITAPSDPSPVVPQPASIPSPVASSTAGPATLPNELTGVWNPSAASPAADPPNQTSSLHTPAQPADPGKSENELGQTNDPTQTLVGPETPVTATPLRTQNINTQQSQPASVGNQNADPSNGLSSTAYISTHQVPTAVIVGGNTITAGGDPVVAGGNTFSIDSGTLHVGPTAVPISAFAYPVGQPQSVQTPQGAFSIINGVTVQPIIPPATTNMPVEVAGIPVSFDPERPGVVVGSKTVLPGAPLVQVAGTLISLGSSDIVVDGSTVPIAQHAGPSPLAATIDSQIIGSGAIYAPSVDGTEPTPEMAATFSGTPLSVDQTGVVVLGSPSITLAENPNPSIFTVGGQTFTAAPQGIPVDGTTLTQGGGAVIISGTPISLAPSGMIIIGSSTAATLSPQSVFTVAGQLFTANPQKFAIGSMSISEGGQGVTISGTPISLGPLGNLFIGTKTAILPKNLPGLGNVIMSAFGPINASATASPSGGAVTGGQPFIGKAARFALCPMWPSVISIGLCVTIVPCL